MTIVKVLYPALDFKDWPKTTDALCLYCSEKCPGLPIPKVNYYNVKNDQFHIQGFFCRPCCALANIKETTFGGESDRSYIWTQVFLKRYLKVDDFYCAPPKTALKKYGGELSLEEFYGQTSLTYLQTLEAPFINSYMIHEFEENEERIFRLKSNDKMEENETIMRPLFKSEPQEQQEIGFPPMILEYLAQQQDKSLQQNDKKETKQKQNSESLLKFMKK
jgi:hypothetical protein